MTARKKNQSKIAKSRVSDEELIARLEDEAPEALNLTVEFDEAMGVVLDIDPADIDRHLAKVSQAAKAKRTKK